jgi:hypothetical protein
MAATGSGLRRYESGAKLKVNNRLLAEIKSFEITERANLTPVMTTVRGLAGFAKGPNTVEGNLSGMVPIEGYEYEFQKALRSGTILRVEAVSGGVTDRFDVALDERARSFDVSQAAEERVSFQGKPVGA